MAFGCTIKTHKTNKLPALPLFSPAVGRHRGAVWHHTAGGRRHLASARWARIAPAGFGGCLWGLGDGCRFWGMAVGFGGPLRGLGDGCGALGAMGLSALASVLALAALGEQPLLIPCVWRMS